MVRSILSRKTALAAAACLAAAALESLAQAQTMTTNSASFNAGYGRYSGEENQPVNVGVTDANGNLETVNGLFQASSSSIFAGSTTRLSSNVISSGAGDSFSGAGGSASAIGNSLNVVVQGDDNTVVVRSQQTNTGDISATTTTNGKP
jgi:holdfast attachment protein HfaA